MGRPRKPPRIRRRSGRRGWYAYLDRDRPHVSLKTEDESVALQRLADLLANPSEYVKGESAAYRALTQGPVVYFIQSGIGGPIKIGRSVRLAPRLRELQTSHHAKLIVLGLLSDEKGREQQVHALFHRERLEGEWFRPSIELLKFISMHTARPR